MKTSRWLVPGTLLLIAVTAGCNVLSAPFFLLASDPKVDPVLKKIASEDGKEVKVAILTYMAMDLRPELLHSDRELSNQLAAALRAGFKENEEKVTVISPRKVDEYKNQHPDWKNQETEVIGEALGADYVIYLEIRELSLYQKKSFNLNYQGSARMTVSLHDVHGTDEQGITQTEFEYSFPSEERGGVWDAGPGNSIGVFREAYLRSLAKHLAWHFTAHTVADDHSCKD